MLLEVGSDEYRAVFERPLVEGCGTCGGGRFIRDGSWRIGVAAQPVFGAARAEYFGVVPCPECNGKSTDWLLERSRLPEAQRGWNFASFEERPGKVEALQAVRAWCERGGGLVLHGDPGRGKTHLASAAVIAACEAGQRAEFWPFQDVLREMQSRFDQEGESAQAFEARVRAVPVLVVDDVGAEYSKSGWSTEVLEALLDDRLRNDRPTLLTTNLPPGELVRHVGARAGDRLQLYHWVECGGESMRAVLGRQMAV